MIKVKEELARSRVERDTIKKQAESVSKEYDRLTEKYSKLSKSQGNKKDDWNVQLIATYLIKYNFKKMFLDLWFPWVILDSIYGLASSSNDEMTKGKMV